MSLSVVTFLRRSAWRRVSSLVHTKLVVGAGYRRRCARSTVSWVWCVREVRANLEVHWPAPDANGWYPILPDADGWMPGHLLLNWPTGQDGLYMVDLQIGDGASPPNVLDTTAPIGIRVDNSAPIAQLAVSWRHVGGLSWSPLGSFCPVVERTSGLDVEFKVDVTVTAGHLRSAQLVGGGCGGDVPQLTSALPPSWEAVVSGALTVGLVTGTRGHSTTQRHSRLPSRRRRPSGRVQLQPGGLQPWVQPFRRRRGVRGRLELRPCLSLEQSGLHVRGRERLTAAPLHRAYPTCR
jgi:hypothetical protein